MSQDQQKRRAAEAALALVESGMRLGLGTGSTAAIFVDLLAEKVRTGLDVICVPTSEATRLQAERGGIRLTTLDETPELDLTVDGADELTAELDLVKGGGGALLREKIVASASARLVIIADASKKVAELGQFPLPIEVVRFGLASTRLTIEELASSLDCSGEIRLRTASDCQPFVTDGGNLILDCAFGRIAEADMLAALLDSVPGIVEHGLFIGMASQGLIGTDTGVEVIDAVDPFDLDESDA